MIKANFKAYSNYVTESLHQWDLNQKLEVAGLNLTSAPEVHFSNKNMDRAIPRQATMTNHVVRVDIPNSLLQDPLRIYAHIGVYEGDTFKVVELVEIPVIPRKRPEDYQIEDTDEEVYSFKALENALANKADNARVDAIIAHNNDTAGNTELVDLRYGLHGDTYDSAGAAVRAQVNKTQPVLYFPGAHFDHDTTAGTLSYVVDYEARQTVSVLTGNATKTMAFIPDTTAFNVAETPNAVRYLVANIQTGTLRSVLYNAYSPAANEYILVAFLQRKVYPMGLSPLDLYENGSPKYANVRDKGVLHSVEDPVVVDLANGKVTLPTVGFYVHDAGAGYSILTAPAGGLSVDIDPASNTLTFVCYDVVEQVLSVVDRKHQFGKNEFCLFGVCAGNAIPIEINPACVAYAGKVDGAATVNDMVAPMFNASKTFKIVLGGDSITHGVGGSGFAQDGDVILEAGGLTWKRNTYGYCWAKQFKEYVEANYNATVLNNGCTGTYSDHWNNYKASLIPDDTDLLILSIGTNDRLTRTGVTTRAEALETYYNNLAAIVKYCHDRGINVVLASPIPASATDEAEARLCHCFELNGIVQKVAAEYGIEYINMYNEVYYHMMDHGLNIDDYFADGLHPNDALYRIMFYKYLKALNLAPSYIAVN